MEVHTTVDQDDDEAQQRRRQEMEVLNSIYQESITFLSMEENKMMLLATLSESIQLKITMQANYPNEKPSVKLLMRCSTKAVNMKKLHEDIDTFLAENEGNEVLFDLIEFIRERLHSVLDDKVVAFDCESENNTTIPADNIYAPPKSTLHIISGDITSERKSTFLSHYCVVDSMEKVNEFYEALLADKKIASATHNILAYRFTDPITGALYQDFDDDGESAAGGRVLEMIRLMKIDGVAVVVSRWFGGILLGADRFKLICQSARTLLEKSYLRK